VSGFLLDTNIASERRKGPRMNANVSAWYESVEDADLFLSVLVVHDLTLVTRNVSAVAHTEVKCLNPFASG
jgi:predicted nucleic acid-binding protein